MLRKIIQINEEKCNGCGLCAQACHEGAIGMINGKANLLRDDYCDGLGDCLPVCPTDAISFVEREAAAYNESAVMANKTASGAGNHSGCMSAAFNGAVKRNSDNGRCCTDSDKTNGDPGDVSSALTHWPVQIKLAPVNAPYFDNADLLIAADCTAYTYGGFHSKFMKDKITLIGCPKLDSIDYSEKLTEILKANCISSVTVTRMEVPCCGGIEHAVKQAISDSGKNIPLEVITIGTAGDIK